ncbi:MAG: hypothetical protein Q7S09_04050 [bacterium]|nr:hypothetical protein [bacterium]
MKKTKSKKLVKISSCIEKYFIMGFRRLILLIGKSGKRSALLRASKTKWARYAKPNIKPIPLSNMRTSMEIAAHENTLCKKRWSPLGSRRSIMATASFLGLNKIPCLKYDITWSKSIAIEPISEAG